MWIKRKDYDVETGDILPGDFGGAAGDEAFDKAKSMLSCDLVTAPTSKPALVSPSA